jgi:hypothetical protein
MLSSRCARRWSFVGRVLRTLGLASLVLTLIFWPAIPARADDPPVHVPETRLQLVVKRVHVFHDEDWIGSGEITIHAAVLECVSPEPHGVLPCTWGSKEVPDRPYASAARMFSFSADSGDDVPLNAIVATSKGGIPAKNSSDPEDATFLVSPGKRYVVAFLGLEGDGAGWEQFGVRWDSFVPYLLIDMDYMGTATMMIDEGNNWGIGPRSLLGGKDYGADFSIEFEIRQPALPDLTPHHAIPRQLDDGRYVICASALNRGEAPAGPFTILLQLDNKEIGTFDYPGLAFSEVVDHCFLMEDPMFGTREARVRVIVNPKYSSEEPALGESDFSNNGLIEMIPAFRSATGQAQSTGTAPGSITNPGPAGGTVGGNSSTSAQADLRPTAIRFQGSDAQGNNDCDPGTNTVTVVVQNRGNAAAGSFAVQLTLDNGSDPAREMRVDRLPSDQEEKVTFDVVTLKKGRHALTVRVDSTNGVAEANEDNNQLSRDVNCKGED